MSDHRKGKRRSYSRAFKRRVVAETLEASASVASVARQHGLNANMVFLWRGDPRFGPGRDAPSFLPVEVTTTEVSCPAEPVNADGAGRIEISLSNGHHIRVIGAYDPDALCRLVRGLR